MIDWKDGAVCFAGGLQFAAPEDGFYPAIGGGAATAGYFNRADFQLNKIREGDYIEASELDTEQKYNDAVEVFGLFGWSFPSRAVSDYEELRDGDAVLCAADFEAYQNARDTGNRKRKLTYPQLMAIGKLKRAMIERDEVERAASKCTCSPCMNGLEGYCMVELKTPLLDVSAFNAVEQSRGKRDKRNKSKQAYDILKSLDYEYDLNKQQWYKKDWV